MEGRLSWGMKTSIHNNIKSWLRRETQVCSRSKTPPAKGKVIPGEERLVNAGSVLLTWQATHSVHWCL